MKKRLIAFLLVSLMMFTFIVACNGDTDDPAPPPTGNGDATTAGDPPPPVDETLDWIDLSMFIAGPGQPPGANNEIVAMIEEATRTRIHFEFAVGDLDSRVGVMIAGGDFPPLIGAGQARARFMESGSLLPLQDIIPLYPNLYEHFALYWDRLQFASPTDNIYIMDIWGRNYGEPFVGHGGPAFWTQKSVITFNNDVIPQHLDDYFDMLYRYWQANPEIDGLTTLPFEILSYSWRSFCLKNAPQHLMGRPNDGDVWVCHDTFYAKIYHDTPEAEYYYRTLNEMFHRGMISPETFTRNYDEYLAVIASGRVLAMFDQQWNFADGENILLADGRYERRYVPIGLTMPGVRQWYKEFPGFIGGNGMGIAVTATEEQVHRAMLFMDYVLSEEMTRLRTWGIYGRDFFIDENGRYRRTEEQRMTWDDPQWRIDNSAEALLNEFPKRQGQFSNGNMIDPTEQPEEMLHNQNDFDREFLGRFGFQHRSDFLMDPPMQNPAYFPVWAFPRSEEVEDIFQRFTEVLDQQLPRVIMADDFDAAWAHYMELLHAVPFHIWIDDVNRQIAERMGITR